MNREQMMHDELDVWLTTAEFSKRVGHHAVPRHSGRDADSKRPRFAEGDPLGARRFASSTSCRMRRASFKNNDPAALNRTPRGNRSSKGKPISLSRSWICRDSGG